MSSFEWFCRIFMVGFILVTTILLICGVGIGTFEFCLFIHRCSCNNKVFRWLVIILGGFAITMILGAACVFTSSPEAQRSCLEKPVLWFDGHTNIVEDLNK